MDGERLAGWAVGNRGGRCRRAPRAARATIFDVTVSRSTAHTRAPPGEVTTTPTVVSRRSVRRPTRFLLACVIRFAHAMALALRKQVSCGLVDADGNVPYATRW